MDTENFIPFSKRDLVAHLAGRLPDARERDDFRAFCDRVEAIYYSEFHEVLEELKASYAPLDPDRVTRSIPGVSPASGPDSARELLDRLGAILVSANYREITRSKIEEAFGSASPWGLELKVSLDDYEYLALHCRGEFPETVVKRKLLFKRKFDYRVFGHVVLAFKLKSGTGADGKGGRGKYRNDKVYLKLFKNVPTVDLEMLFPDTEIKIRLFDKMKVVLPLAAGAASSLYKIGGYVLGHGADQHLWTQVGFWTLVGGLFGIALKGFFSYRNTVEKYLRTLTESLYFQNLDNNSGVFKYLLDDAEEEEAKELILGYYFLHFEADRNFRARELDERIEAYFRDELGQEIDFEVDDSLRKLHQLGLLEEEGDRLRVPALPRATELLRR